VRNVEDTTFSIQSADMAVRLSDFRAGLALTPGIVLILISVRDLVNPRA
jgi:hypothetical protein